MRSVLCNKTFKRLKHKGTYGAVTINKEYGDLNEHLLSLNFSVLL